MMTRKQSDRDVDAFVQREKGEGREVACRGDHKLGTACGRCWRCQERNVPPPKED